MLVEERLQPALKLRPEVASLNMGSMNFGLYEMIPRYKEWKHGWELPYLAGSDERIFKNTFRDIAHILESCSGNDTRFEVECYDIGHLYTASALSRTRVAQAAALHPVGVRHPRRHRAASRGRDAHEANGRSPVRQRLQWSVLARAAIRCTSPPCRRCLAATFASGWRIASGSGRAPRATNADQVAKIRRILEELGLEIATPEETRKILKLKGRDNVNF